MAGTILTALNKYEKSKKRIKKSLDVYNTLIASSPFITVNTKGFIEEKIDLLNDELSGAIPHIEEPNIEEAVQNFQKAMARDASVIDLRKGVKAAYKKGLYAEALESLKLLIQKNAADEFCVTAVMGCILHLNAKEQLAEAVDRFITDAIPDSEKGALFKSLLADKMTKMGYAKHAAMLQ